MNENGIKSQSEKTDSNFPIAKCKVVVGQPDAVEADAESSVSSSSGNAVSGANPLSPQCDVTVPTPRIFYSTLADDDDFTDEDFELLMEGTPSKATVPLVCCHMTSVQPVPASGIDIKAPCAQCNSTDENWICLICYEVYCSRYVNKHMVEHTQKTSHPITLSFTDVTVWCYGCDDYVHGDMLNEARNIVIKAKFGSLQDGLMLESTDS